MTIPSQINIEFNVNSITDYNILPTHWFDLKNTLSSSFSSRDNFVFINDTYINGTYSYTTYTNPYQGYGDAFMNSLAKDYLTADNNWYTVGISSNDESFKTAISKYGAGFSRRLKFNSIEPFTYSTGNTQSIVTKFNFNPGQCLLDVNDRVLVVKTDGRIDEYNTYGDVLSVSNINGWTILDIPYVSYTYSQSGYMIEGTSFYDYSIVNSNAQITTLNDHNLNVDDQVVIQMDTQGRATLRITASLGQTISSIYVLDPNGQFDLMNNTVVTYTTTLPAFIDSIKNVINSENQIEDFRAYRSTSNDLYIFTGRYTNNYYEGVGFSSVGSITMTYSNISYLGGYDLLGRGYNPQITGFYIVNSVPSSTTFTLDKYLPNYYNNEPFTDRGTIYSITDYKFSDLTIGDTYSYLFASLNTESELKPLSELSDVFPKFKMDQTNPAMYLSSRTILNNNSYGGSDITLYESDYYSTYEVYTLDVLRDNINTSNNLNSIVVTRNFTNTSDVITFSSITSTSSKCTLGVGPWNLNEFWVLNPLNVSTFSNPGTDPYPICEEVVSYTVAAYHNSFKVTKDFKFNKRCSDRATMQVAWLNEWGAFDYYTFFSPLQQTYKYLRNNFYKSGNYRDGVTQITSDPTQRGETSFKLDRSLELKLTSSHLRGDEVKVLQSLVSSGNCFLILPYAPHDDIKQFSYAINVINDEFKIPSPQSKLKYLEFDIRMGSYNYFNRQNIN